jgi:hypothetical protein
MTFLYLIVDLIAAKGYIVEGQVRSGLQLTAG